MGRTQAGRAEAREPRRYYPGPQMHWALCPQLCRPWAPALDLKTTCGPGMCGSTGSPQTARGSRVTFKTGPAGSWQGLP